MKVSDLSPVVLCSPQIEVPAELSSHYEKALRLLKTSEATRGLNLERIGHDGIWTLRLNQKSRLLFVRGIYEVDGQVHPVVIVLEVDANHQFEESRFLKNGVLRDFLAKEGQALLESYFHRPFDATQEKGKDEPLAKGGSYVPVELTPYHGKFILLTPEQEEAVVASLPLEIEGPAGSGKTVVALEWLQKLVEQQRALVEQGIEPHVKPVLYVADSKELVESLEQMYGQLPNACPEAVRFVCYRDLLRELGESRVQVDDEHLKGWLANYIRIGQRLGVTEGLDERFFSNVDLLIQEFRKISAYSRDEWVRYQTLGRHHSLFGEEVQKEWLFKAYWEYQDTLKQDGVIHPAFCKLSARDVFFGVVADEKQNFSAGQIQSLIDLSHSVSGRVQICLLGDVHQSIWDGLPNHLKQIGDVRQVLHGLKTVYLSRVYRCPQEIVNAMGYLQDLKRHLLGKAVGYDYTGVVESGASSQCPIAWVEAPTPEMATNLSPGVVVITLDELVGEAMALFPHAVVLTPQQTQGMEFDEVIAYRLLPPPAIRTIVSRVGRDALLAPHEVRPGDTAARGNEVESTELVRQLRVLHTAMTRTMRSFTVCQGTKIRALADFKAAFLKNANGAQPVVMQAAAAAVVDSSPVIQALEPIGQITNLERLEALQQQWQDQEQMYQDKGFAQAVTRCRDNLQLIVQRMAQLPVQAPIPAVEEAAAAAPQDEFSPQESQVTTAELAKRKRRKKKGQKKSSAEDVLIGDQAPSTLSSPSFLLDIRTLYVAGLYKDFTLSNLRRCFESPHARLFLFETPLDFQIQSSQPDFCLFSAIFSSKSDIEVLKQCLDQNPKYGEQILTYVNENTGISGLTYLSDGPEARATLLALLKSNPSLCQIITAKALCLARPVQAGVNQNTSPLYWLSDSPDGHEILKLLFDLNPVLSEEITAESLCLARPVQAGLFANLSPLLLLSSSSKGRMILQQLFDSNPNLYQGMTAESLCLACPAQAGIFENVSALFWLINSAEGRVFLQQLFDANPKVCQHITAESLCLARPAQAGIPENLSPFYILSVTAEGCVFLQRLFDKNPDLYTQITAEQLCLATKTAPFENASPLFLLLTSAAGRAFLQRLFNLNPNLYKRLTAEQLCLAVKSGPYENKSPLALFSGYLEGRTILEQLFKANPNLCQQITAEQLGLASKAGPNENTSALYWLAASPEGRALLQHLFETNPNLCKQITAEQLCLIVKAGSNENTSALYWFASNLESYPILEGLFDVNPDLCKQITAESLFFTRPAQAGREANLSPFYFFAASSAGCKILQRLFKANPTLCQSLSAETLCLTINKPIEGGQNISPLYCLAGSAEGCELLEYLLNRNPDLRQNITAHALCLECTFEEVETSGSVLNLLSFWPEGRRVLKLLFKENLSLIKEISFGALSRPHKLNEHQPLSSTLDLLNGSDDGRELLMQYWPRYLSQDSAAAAAPAQGALYPATFFAKGLDSPPILTEALENVRPTSR